MVCLLMDYCSHKIISKIIRAADFRAPGSINSDVRPKAVFKGSLWNNITVLTHITELSLAS